MLMVSLKLVSRFSLVALSITLMGCRLIKLRSCSLKVMDMTNQVLDQCWCLAQIVS